MKQEEEPEKDHSHHGQGGEFGILVRYQESVESPNTVALHGVATNRCVAVPRVDGEERWISVVKRRHLMESGV